MDKLEIKIDKNMSVLDFLANQDFSYGYSLKLLRQKDVRINGEKISKNLPLKVGDVITIFYKKLTPKFDVLFEDENVVVINKPIGIEVEGENGVAQCLGAIAVHRLDRNTTGLLILAKNEQSEQELLSAFKNHTVIKKYLAHVYGVTKFKNFDFKAYLLKNSAESKVKIFEKCVKNSVFVETIFNTVSADDKTSVVKCLLMTGKTHQIRASLAYLNYPIIGDRKYAKNEIKKSFKEKYQKLHCYYLKFQNLGKHLGYLNELEFINYPKWYKK